MATVECSVDRPDTDPTGTLEGMKYWFTPGINEVYVHNPLRPETVRAQGNIGESFDTIFRQAVSALDKIMQAGKSDQEQSATMLG